MHGRGFSPKQWHKPSPKMVVYARPMLSRSRRVCPNIQFLEFSPKMVFRTFHSKKRRKKIASLLKSLSFTLCLNQTLRICISGQRAKF